MTSNIKTPTAKLRWKLLKRALLQHSLPEQNSEDIQNSVRRFNSFSLFKVVESEDNELWKHENAGITVVIKKFSEKLQYEDMRAFDNTGNVCIWVAEEVMAYYCIENINLFRDKTICELGGGFSNLAGMFLSKTNLTKEILLTDGNEKSVRNLKSLISSNKSNAKSQVLRFDEENSYAKCKNTFDIILSADCLFFDAFRQNLVTAIYDLLKVDGIAYIFAPKRGKTFTHFVEIANEKFGHVNITIHENYNDKVWKTHCLELNNTAYDKDLHYPFLIQIKKI